MTEKLVKLYRVWESAHLAFVAKADALPEWSQYLLVKEQFDKARTALVASKKAYDIARHALPERLIAEKINKERRR